MNTAIQAANLSDSISFSFYPNSSTDKIYVFTHFAELTPAQSRGINIYLNGLFWYQYPYLPYLQENTVYTRNLLMYNIYQFKINSTGNSTLPALINAFEAYIALYFVYNETDEHDVMAITSIKHAYGIARNWQGDPCLPKTLLWIGVNCSYNGFRSPNIISLNLSSSGLIGSIAPSIGNLTLLQVLDLSYNNLTGEVPEFLCWLSSLKHLNLVGNNFTSPLPPELLKKSKNGSLTLSIGSPQSPINNHTKPLTNGGSKKNIVVPVVSSVVSFIFILISAAVVLCYVRRRLQKHVKDKPGDGSMVEHGDRPDNVTVGPTFRLYKFSEVQSFLVDENVIGRGGFGMVCHGCMDGTEVAIKKLILSRNSELKDFQTEVNILAKVHHIKLTSLIGYFNEGTEKGIICEFMENGSLRSHLSDIANPECLSWDQRVRIMVDSAIGLDYLHHGCNPPIIHRDINPSNILLTREFGAKISDFGLSKDSSAHSIRVVGTDGYRDPQYIHPRMLTNKIDVYSFGVVLLELVTGRPVIEGTTHITRWVTPMIETGDIRGVVDPRLDGQFNVNVAGRIIDLAIKCVSRNSSSRPDMRFVARELEECLLPTVSQHEWRESATARSMFNPQPR